MSTSDNGTCQCCPRCRCRVTSTDNRNMGLETEAGATDIKSYTNSAPAEVVDAGSNNNNNNDDDEERISLAESARETRRTHAAAAALLLLSRSGTAMGSSSLTGRERNTNRKEIGVTVLSARTKKITGPAPVLRTLGPCAEVTK